MPLIKGERLCLRQATLSDLDYIMRLEYAKDNVQFIVPFSREKHQAIITEVGDGMDIVVETLDTKEPVGYLLVEGLTELGGHVHEWTHIIVEQKGRGYGHEVMKLIKAWSFTKKKAHRLWVDCKDWNVRALHLYESEGLLREGVFRETLFTDGVYENLIVLAILEEEYLERCKNGLELGFVG